MLTDNTKNKLMKLFSKLNSKKNFSYGDYFYYLAEAHNGGKWELIDEYDESNLDDAKDEMNDLANRNPDTEYALLQIEIIDSRNCEDE